MSENDDVRELLPAWALDAVDADERARVERAVRADPALAAEARSLLETAAGLAAGAAAAPPPELRARVLDAVRDTPQEGAATQEAATTQEGAAPTSRPAHLRTAGEAHTDPARPAASTGSDAGAGAAARRPRPWTRWALAASILLAAAIPGALAVQQYQRAERAESHVAEIADTLARPGAELVVAEAAGGGRAAAVITGGEALFLAGELPDVGDGNDYQLWLIHGEDVASAGVLPVEDGRTRAEVADLGEGAVLGVTVEPAGGSPLPTSDPILTIAAG